MVQPGPLSASLQDERELHLHPGVGVLVPLDGAAGFQHHVVEDGAVVRFGDARGGLHGLGREADLAAHQRAPGSSFRRRHNCCTA